MWIKILSLILFLILSSPEISLASSYVKSTSETNVEGEGKVYTRLEVEANGEKKVIESSEEGKIELIIEKSGGVETNTTDPVESEQEEQNDESRPKNIIEYVIDLFRKLLEKLRLRN